MAKFSKGKKSGNERGKYERAKPGPGGGVPSKMGSKEFTKTAQKKHPMNDESHSGKLDRGGIRL